MRINLIVALILVVSSSKVRAQIETQTTLQLEFSPVKGSVDSRGNLYLISPSGKIVKLDSQLNPVAEFSSPNSTIPDSFEAGSGLKILCFYKNVDEIILLNRSLSLAQRISTAEFQDLPVDLCALSTDGHLWYVGESQNKLFKYNINFRREDLVVELPDSLVGKVSSLQRNQYNTILRSENWLTFLDNNGQVIKQVELENSQVYLAGDYLLSIDEQQILLRNVYTGEDKSLNLDTANQIFLGYDGSSKLYFSSGNTLTVYQIIN